MTAFPTVRVAAIQATPVILDAEVFPNCPRYIPRMALVERSRFVPRADHGPPIPDWKRTDWACDVLPEGDPARSL